MSMPAPGAGGKFRKENPKAGAPAIEWLLVQFCVVSATGLLIGTVQGVLPGAALVARLAAGGGRGRATD